MVKHERRHVQLIHSHDALLYSKVTQRINNLALYAEQLDISRGTPISNQCAKS